MKNIRYFLYAIFIVYLISFVLGSTTYGRDFNVLQKKFFTIGSQKKEVELAESREVGKYKVVIKYKNFDKTKRKLKFHKRYKTSLIKVDNQEYYGTDGTLPTREISSIALFEKSKRFGFPSVQYNLLFEPHIGKNYVEDAFSVKEHSSYLEINLSGGDGAGGYEVIWLVFKKSKVIKRKLSDHLVLDGPKKPSITFSKLRSISK